MSRTAAIFLATMLPATAVAADQIAICTNYAEAILTGFSKPCGFRQDCRAEAWRARASEAGFDCEPFDRYFEIAKARIDARSQAPQPVPYVAPPIVPQSYQLPPPVRMKAPTQTTCTQVGAQTYCTTTGD